MFLFIACSKDNIVKTTQKGQTNKQKSVHTLARDAVKGRILGFKRELQIELLEQNAGLATIIM